MIPHSTVGFVVSQYERRGYDAWVAFSLTERSEIVHRHWGVKISRSSLRNLYRANGVYYS